MTSVTQVLKALEQNDPTAADQLLPLVYDELRKLAGAKLAREQPGQTLQATALVHEAYLRLVGSDRRAEPGSASGGSTGQSGPADADGTYNSRGHFFAAAAEAMRRILVENARRKQRLKHGGGRERVELLEIDLATKTTPDEVLAVDEALSRLEREDPQAAQLVKLCYFTGMSVEQAAAEQGVSRATAYRHWTYARAWLRCEILDESPNAENP